VTALVVTLKVADEDPAATVTFAGTVAALPLLRNVITAPPAGAGLERVTVPVREPPPVTDVDDSVNI